MFPSYTGSGFRVGASATQGHPLTVGARAVNHLDSFEMSIELLHPVPEAMGSLLLYTVVYSPTVHLFNIQT